MAIKQRITPFLWFDGKAEEAADFYTSIFPNSRIKDISRYTEAGFEFHGQPAGTVMTVEFELDGMRCIALNGGPMFKFNEAISLMVTGETQAEVDYYWEKLTEGGDPAAQQCGWLKDKFGVSWQVVPSGLAEVLGNDDSEKADEAMDKMLTMKKLDMEALKSPE